MAVLERPASLNLRQQSLSDVVYSEILDLILQRIWPPRSRLPSEVDLVARFGVSRPIVRQALARLREENYIASRQGSGSFVQERDQAPSADTLLFPPISSIADLERCLQFREGVEGEAAATAAMYRTEMHLAELQAAQKSARLAELTDDNAETDFAFHLAVARASENPFYVNTLMSLKEQIIFEMNLARSFSGKSGAIPSMTSRQHEAVMTAITNRQPDAARELMRSHIEWSGHRMLTGGIRVAEQ